MNAGDLLVVHCWYGVIPYSHFAIDMGDGTVIQLARDPNESNRSDFNLKSMSVRLSSIEEFAEGRQVHVIEVENALDADQVVERARSKLGTNAYCLVSGNCEHFARWCKTGLWVSEQVHETRESMARTAVHAAVILSERLGRIGSSVAAGSGIHSRTRIAIPSLVGEITEQITKCSLKCCNLSPKQVESGSAIASYGTVAVLGLVLGGPAGSLTALAAHSLARSTPLRRT